MCKYYFGYHYYNGQFWPMMWYTENGITMGGHPEIVPGTLKETRECEFFLETLSDLAVIYGPDKGTWLTIRKDMGLT